MTEQPDDRSPLAVATAWASVGTSIALEMALPALLGHWIDGWLDTGVWFLILGALFGFAAGMWHLLRLAGKGSPGFTNFPPDRHPPDSTQHDDKDE